MTQPPPATDCVDLPTQSSEDSSDITICLRDAHERKDDGNGHFRANRWNEALVSYLAGLGSLPKRLGGPPVVPSRRAEDEDVQKGDLNVDAAPSSDGGNGAGKLELTETEKECAKIRAVLNANIAACHIKLGDHKDAVEACTQALLDDPTYVKALQRRAASNEILNTWSSLSASQQDYTDLLKLIKVPSQTREIETKLRSLKPRVEASQKKETAEVLDKLKGLGNSILGNFGLSTNNFQFSPNEQGGYSMNFKQ